MTYQFDTEFAQRYGLQEAIFCQSLLYWIIKNAANERHWHTAEVTLPGGETVTVEGYWMYNSAKAFTRLFPFWTARQIETIVKKCREKGLIYTANFAEKPTDRGLSQEELAETVGVSRQAVSKWESGVSQS